VRVRRPCLAGRLVGNPQHATRGFAGDHII
jgi:hypothetical protein